MIITRTPLRISFLGGGSDLPSHYEQHGGAVLSVTINKYIYIMVKRDIRLFPHKYRLVYSQIEECNDPAEIKHPIIKELVATYGLKSLDLDIMSDIPAGTGLGSSSAFTVGLHQAMLGTSFGTRDPHWLANRACETEITRLKEPIGKQDQYAAAFGGLNLFTFTKGQVVAEPIVSAQQQENLRQHIILVYIGGQRKASSILREQSTRDNSKSLSRMADLASEAYCTLLSGYTAELGPKILENWQLKKELAPGISTPAVDNIIDTALANGATGGKLLGAGGAGFVLLFCPPASRNTMLNALKPLRLTYLAFQFETEGSKILYEDFH